jgi:hypothetical protein
VDIKEEEECKGFEFSEERELREEEKGERYGRKEEGHSRWTAVQWRNVPSTRPIEL